MDLFEFAETNKTVRPCWVCDNVPKELQARMVEGLKKKIGPTIQANWLKGEGYAFATPAKVEHHLQRHAQKNA